MVHKDFCGPRHWLTGHSEKLQSKSKSVMVTSTAQHRIQKLFVHRPWLTDTIPSNSTNRDNMVSRPWRVSTIGPKVPSGLQKANEFNFNKAKVINDVYDFHIFSSASFRNQRLLPQISAYFAPICWEISVVRHFHTFKCFFGGDVSEV